MLTASVALVVYIACAFGGDGNPSFGIFETKEACEAGVKQARGAGYFVTECERVEFKKPSNGNKS